MQVGILPAAPLPGGVKVARRPVKPLGVAASPTRAANFQGVMSAADGRLHSATTSERGGRRCSVGAIPTPSANFKPLTKGSPMKPVLRYQSQLLFRKSYKPIRVIRIRPVKLNFSFRPVRFDL